MSDSGRHTGREAGPSQPEGRILRVKAGYNPNSSSVGSLVFAFPAYVLVGTALFGMAAGALATALLRPKPKPPGDAAPAPREAGSDGPGSPTDAA